VRIYRALLHLYPRQFRREFGDDMVALIEDQLRDESSPRVVGRTVLDLVLTVPARHLEVHMNRTSATALIVTFVAVGAGLVILGGPIGLAAALAAFALAAVTWRRTRPVVAVDSGRWWKLLLSGVILLATVVVVTTITGELHNGTWYIAMASLLTALGLMGAGIVLGIAGRFGTRAV
jgi:hypothetical protein